MITFDLSRIAERGPGKLDEQDYQRLAAAVEGSVRVHLRAQRIAYREVVRRVTDRHFGTVQIETVVRLDGKHLHLDLDLEVPLGITSAANSR